MASAPWKTSGVEMKQRSKANEPSLRDKLSGAFMAAMEEDFAANGKAVIEQLRVKHPDRYAELAARLIAQTEPPNPNDLSQAKSLFEVGRMLLQGVGLHDPSDQQIEAAMAANNRLMTELETIAAVDIALRVTEEYEERSLRS